MGKPTVLVTDHNFEDLSMESEMLSDIARVDELEREDGEEMSRQLSDANALLVRMFEIDRDIISELDNCRVISRYGIGVDHIATDAATEKGIYVGNAPTYCVEEVAIHTTALILNLLRNIKPYDELVAENGWKTKPPRFSSDRGEFGLPIYRHTNQTVGIVGFGTLGRNVCERLSQLGFNVVVHDPYISPDEVEEYEAELVEFDDLSTAADYITIHSPLTEGTRHLFDEEAFSRMKNDAYIVNCARGAIIDEDALYSALTGGEIAGAALDVFETEPPEEDDPLRDHRRVITTPHVAYYSEEADRERRKQAIENVRAVLQGDAPPYPVNDPQ